MLPMLLQPISPPAPLSLRLRLWSRILGAGAGAGTTGVGADMTRAFWTVSLMNSVPRCRRTDRVFIKALAALGRDADDVGVPTPPEPTPEPDPALLASFPAS